MLFTYEAIDTTGAKKKGSIEAASKDLAIAAIQRRGFIVSSMREEGEKKGFMNVTIFEKRVASKDIVIMSRQISTLFEAQVSALKAFNLLATNTENEALVKILNAVSEDIQAKTQQAAKVLFEALACEGMARVDLFYDLDSKQIYFNEVNTIPGFTQISMYPKLMGATGVSYSDLLTHLIKLAIKRHTDKSRLIRSYVE